jgi:type IV pilus assembly protein PilX
MKKRILTSHHVQRGAVLVISLIMLLVLTLIGITGMQSTVLEEKMAGNYRDKNLAFQAAESALRDAENDIRTSGRVSGATGMDASCTNGLCYSGGNDIATIWGNSGMVSNASSLGDYTPAMAITGVNSQPRYLIVGIDVFPYGAAAPKTIYKITAIAEGGTASSQSILQEVFAP